MKKKSKYIIGKYFYDSEPGAGGNGKSNGYGEFDTKEKVRKFICSKDNYLCKETDIEEVLNKGGFLGRFVVKNKYGFCEHKYYLFFSLKDGEEGYRKGLKVKKIKLLTKSLAKE